MDKLAQFKTAIDEIVDDERVTLEQDGTYTVRRDDGAVFRVACAGVGEWVVQFEDGDRAVPYAPTGQRPHELIAWTLV
jgi:hypothetical protein